MEITVIALKGKRIDWVQTDKNILEFVKKKNPHGAASVLTMRYLELTKLTRKVARKLGTRFVIQILNERKPK